MRSEFLLLCENILADLCLKYLANWANGFVEFLFEILRAPSSPSNFPRYLAQHFVEVF